MKTMICLPLAFAALALAGEASDRAAIERVVAVLNDRTAAAGVFTADAQNELGRLSDLDRRLVRAEKPWSEVTTPRILVQSIRFVTQDVALVDAANTQFGSTILVRRVPVLLVMKREGNEWRVASFRVLVDLAGLPEAGKL